MTWTLENGPTKEWTDAEWDNWFAYRQVTREGRRALKRDEYAQALAQGRYITERGGSWFINWQLKDGGSWTAASLAEHIESREYGFGFEVTIADYPHRGPYRPGLSVNDCRDLLLMRGFTHVETMAGPVPVDSWTPYGNGIERTWRGELLPDGRVRDLPSPEALKVNSAMNVLGVWHAVTLAA